MTTLCGTIAASVSANCADPLVQGLDDELIILNKADIDTITRNSTNQQVVEGITLVTASPSKVAYKVTGRNMSNAAHESLVNSRYGYGFKHEIIFHVFGNDSDYKKFVDDLVGGRYVAITKNNYENLNKVGTPSDSLYEISGLDMGLYVTAVTRNRNDAETKGAFVVTLSSMDGYEEPHLPATFFITSKAATQAAVDALGA